MTDKQLNFKLLDISFLSSELFSIKLERGDFSFEPGQCFSLGVSSLSVNREYSVYSRPEDNFLEFYIRLVDDGCLTPYLANLKKDDYVSLNGPFGTFSPSKEELKKPHCFIATGTGIAPFNSIIGSFPKLDYKLIHGVRYEHEIPINQFANDNKYFPCFSRAKDITNRKKVTDYLSSTTLDPTSLIYLCGNRNMIVEVTNILLGKGFNSEQIRMEVFF
ncbi:FAD-binding oxidoreductase [Alphaproteobacteria bacterium]|nr:FAD-binding oxidoreductase [Alphaproteobacteria bacterium]